MLSGAGSEHPVEPLGRRTIRGVGVVETAGDCGRPSALLRSADDEHARADPDQEIAATLDLSQIGVIIRDRRELAVNPAAEGKIEKAADHDRLWVRTARESNDST